MAFHPSTKNFYLITTNSQLKTFFGDAKGSILFDKFRINFETLDKSNSFLMPDEISQRLGASAIFVLSLFITLEKQNVSFDDLQKISLNVYCDIMNLQIKSLAAPLEVSENPWEDFLSLLQKNNLEMYDNDYYQLQYTYNERSRFGFDFHQCLVHKILLHNDHPELTPIICKFHSIFSDNFQKWANFSQFETIAKGYDRCTFRYFKN
ncbi:hypothetical protein NEF87_001834 [Candidatus Lokiarchaeum ossiferum]|uniref:L-2-amino-thiazoline-4-carboxylic acid hydrolase n=1 Tax=Candidatus Lokiarchaeum ossiferum TaxID=2951803 RepID=A0ABY6HPV9_9ARCH|nr:hypothetical protein NEF87_001834 [Candidatus Lokiarchaeum sp. B-35]